MKRSNFLFDILLRLQKLIAGNLISDEDAKFVSTLVRVGVLLYLFQNRFTIKTDPTRPNNTIKIHIILYVKLF